MRALGYGDPVFLIQSLTLVFAGGGLCQCAHSNESRCGIHGLPKVELSWGQLSSGVEHGGLVSLLGGSC